MTFRRYAETVKTIRGSERKAWVISSTTLVPLLEACRASGKNFPELLFRLPLRDGNGLKKVSKTLSELQKSLAFPGFLGDKEEEPLQGEHPGKSLREEACGAGTLSKNVGDRLVISPTEKGKRLHGLHPSLELFGNEHPANIAQDVGKVRRCKGFEFFPQCLGHLGNDPVLPFGLIAE